MKEELIQFVDHARERGMDYATIRGLLQSHGWKDRQIAEALCARDLELAVPTPPAIGLSRTTGPRRPGGGPRKARDAFLHLLTYGSMYVWSTSVILLLFAYVDFAFPDAAWRTSYNRLQEILSIMRVQLALVVVAFPIFLVAWNHLLREVRQNPEIGKSVLRRWLGNLTLFVGVVTLAGDAMTLIYFLLEGQLNVRFLLKATVLFLIAGGLVGYLAWTLRCEARGVGTQTETNS